MKRGIAEKARVAAVVDTGDGNDPGRSTPLSVTSNLSRAKYQQDGLLFVLGDPAHDTC